MRIRSDSREEEPVTTACGRHSGLSHFPYDTLYVALLTGQALILMALIVYEVIAGGVFTSVGGLKRRIIRYIRRHSDDAKRVRWFYSDPRRRIAYLYKCGLESPL